MGLFARLLARQDEGQPDIRPRKPRGNALLGPVLFKTLNGPTPRSLAKHLADGWSVESRAPWQYKGTNYGTTYHLTKPNPEWRGDA